MPQTMYLRPRSILGNRSRVETVDGDDVGCACGLESVGYFGTDVTLYAGKQLNEQQCLHLESFNYLYYAVANAKNWL